MSRLWPLLLLLVAGCGGEGSELIKVTGTVANADGAPLKFENGTVIFVPNGSGENASGAVQPDGSFTMTTTMPDDGVAPGEYKVAIQLWKSYRDQTLAIPKKYGDQMSTPLTATVDDDHTHFDFKLEK